MKHVNILTRYTFPLFAQHFDATRYAKQICFVENSEEAREWDLVIVFDGLPAKRKIRVKRGGLVFIAGEPPDAMRYTAAFLDQFDGSFCSHTNARKRVQNNPAQHFNNWHFGHNPLNRSFRWTYNVLQAMPAPAKTKDMSIIMSNLAYMPNHLKRLHFLSCLRERFGEKVDVFGRGHNFMPYKDDVLLPYRFHICIENCVTPDLWTEKLADPFLGWSIPVYAGCPNLNQYFPDGSFIKLDIDDVEGSLMTISLLLDNAQTEYERRLGALQMARKRVMHDYNIAELAVNLLSENTSNECVTRIVLPNEETPRFMLSNYMLRLQRLAYRQYFLLTRGAIPHRNSAPAVTTT